MHKTRPSGIRIEAGRENDPARQDSEPRTGDSRLCENKLTDFDACPGLTVREGIEELSSLERALREEIARRQRAEEALRESERRLDEVQQFAQVASYEKRPYAAEAYWSEELYRLFGYEAGEAPNAHELFRSHVRPDDLARLKTSLEEALSGEADYKCEIGYTRKNGEARRGLISGRAAVDEASGQTTTKGVFQDITERKLVEDRLTQANDHLENILENSPDAIGIVDRRGRFIKWNRKAADLYGYTFDELNGKSSFDLYADPNELDRMLGELRLQGSVKQYEVNMKRKDGAVAPFRISVSLLRDEAGAVIGSVCVARDFSPILRAIARVQTEMWQRRKTEEALKEYETISRESETKYRRLSLEFHTVLNAIPDALILLTADLEVVWANRAFAARIGKEEEISTLIGRRCYEVWHGRSIPCDPCPAPKAFQTGEPACEHMTLSDGSVFEIRSVPVRNEDGKVVNVINLTRDITQHRKLEKQLRHAQKMEAIGALTGGVAHDFNNILGIILGFADIAMMDAPKDGQLIDSLEQIRKAAYRATDLVKQMLAFSRKGEQAFQPVHLGVILKEVLKLLRAALPATIDIRRNIEIAPDRMDAVSGDLTQIHQVIMNLCTNARDAMREHGGVLEAGLTAVDFRPDDLSRPAELEPGPYLCITIGDTGCGMNQGVMERIFEPFYTTKKSGEGTGLGLSVVHGIVKNHGGAITVYSEVGRGTKFNVYLPALESEAVFEEKTALPLQKGSETVLFVDDEAALAKTGKKMLEYLGYKVVSHTSSIEALEAFRAQPDAFDLVVTDQTMPLMTGAELALNLLDIRETIPIILVTGFSESITMEKAKELGIREFLMKPLMIGDIAGAVRRVLDGKR